MDSIGRTRLILGFFVLAGCAHGPSRSDSATVKLNWNIATYYNPRVSIDGKDQIPFHDDATATKWCQSVPGKKYAAGISAINFVNPQDGMRYRWNGDAWIAVNGGDYPRIYTCVESRDLLPTL